MTPKHTYPAFRGTLDQLVSAAALRSPAAPAVRAVDAALDYAALDAAATRIAHHLAALGVRPGDRVALWAPKSVGVVAAVVGIMRAGAAYLPIDPAAPLERARFIIEHCQARVLLTGGGPLAALGRALPAERPPVEVVASIDGPAPVVDGARTAALEASSGSTARGEPGPPPPRSSGERSRPVDGDLAYVLYTSGSTGRPKGVAITHAQSLAFVLPAVEVFELTAADVVASHAALNFDLSVIDLYCTFAAGASVVLIPERYLPFPAKVASLIQDLGITVWNSVPSALIQLTQHGQLASRDLSRLRLVMFAGEPYPAKHLRALREAAPHARLLNVYGQTEANSSTYHEVSEIPPDGQLLPIGKTLPNYHVFALDLEGRPITTPGVEGELYVRSNAVASGYFDDPVRTERAFVQNPLEPSRRDIVYRTGDRVSYDADGNLLFHGRADAVVKVRGFRVELGELESVVGALPGIVDVAVIAVPDEDVTNRLVLYYATAEGAEVSVTEVTEALVKRVLRAMVPEHVIREVALPRTPNGKTDRRALVDRATAVVDAARSG